VKQLKRRGKGMIGKLKEKEALEFGKRDSLELSNEVLLQ
jgi:hypothetical protein